MKSQIRLSGGRKLQSPKGLNTRPTTSLVREALMNLLGEKLVNANWLDLFSGSGVMSCEALQKGANRIVAVEKDGITAKICKSNLVLTASGLNREAYIDVIRDDVIKFLLKGFKALEPNTHHNNYHSKFDLVYIDPPYDLNIYSSVLISLIKGTWVKQDSIIICEHSSKSTLTIDNGWKVLDKRNYGKSSLLLISPPRHYLYDIDSKQQQTTQE